MKVRIKWNNLPKHVLETVTPLLEARFNLARSPYAGISAPYL